RCSRIQFALGQRATTKRVVALQSPILNAPKLLPASTGAVPGTAGPDGGCNPIVNGGFESGDFTGWTIDGFNNPPVVTNTDAHSGKYAAFVGGHPPQFCVVGIATTGDSSFYQQFTVPINGGTLSFWHWDCTTNLIFFA